ncbi:hypothetical protein [Nocardia sp. CA-120079]|uniref:hypothetical protein n=1 Tax=Nocardia sp. CA-120079 TaxID=3239974 RepID=UPI003D97FBED
MSVLISLEDRRISAEVLTERANQDARWGEQNHPDGTGPAWARDEFGGLGGKLTATEYADLMRWYCATAAAADRVTFRHILIEEIAEAFAEDDPIALRMELIQVAAVAQAWVAKLDRELRTGVA